MADRITLRRFFDAHCHFRLEPLLSLVLPFTAQYARYGVAMPNTRPRAILTAEDVVWYYDLIQRVLEAQTVRPLFEPLMTIEIRDNTTPEMVVAAKKVGAVIGKGYPLGVTTHSDEGIREFFVPGILSTFRMMEEIGMPLSLHGQLSAKRLLLIKWEPNFLPILEKLHEMFPGLKIILEHVSSKEGVAKVRELGDNVVATITGHHLCSTLNDVLAGGLNPHNACMPMPNDFDDLDAVVGAATSGEPKFFSGSDTAPHGRGDKECAKGRNGVFTAPVLPSLLVEIFEQQGCLGRQDNFASGFGLKFYGLPAIEETITMVREPWIVPEQYGEGDNVVVPFKAGEEFQWRLEP